MMAMTGFFCQDDYLSKTAKLTDEEVGRLFRACMKYHITGQADDMQGRESIAFDFIREDIDKAEQAYANKCEQNKRNRMKGTLTVVNDGQRTMTAVKEPEPETTELKPKQKRFQPPTLEEVKAYCAERNNNVDAEHWYDYYTSNGWRVGKNPMKDWKGAVRTWEKSEIGKKPVKAVSGQQYTQRNYSNTQADAMNRFLAENMEG